MHAKIFESLTQPFMAVWQFFGSLAVTLQLQVVSDYISAMNVLALLMYFLPLDPFSTLSGYCILLAGTRFRQCLHTDVAAGSWQHVFTSK